MTQSHDTSTDTVGLLAGLALVAMWVISMVASPGVLPYFNIALGLLVYFLVLGALGDALERSEGDILFDWMFWLAVIAVASELAALFLDGRNLYRPIDGFRIFQFVVCGGFVLALVVGLIREGRRFPQSA